MFVTRPRSLYRNFPRALFVRPASDAPYSGHIVVSDEQSEEMDTSCWGICKNSRISRLPFPQDRILKVVHASEQQEPSVTKVWFLPVPGQPLSSNRYFVIKAKGRHKGRAYTCSRGEDIEGCCFNSVRVDLTPKPFDHRDIYQQFQILPYQNGFYALPVAGDGCPPTFLRRKGWEVYTAQSFKLHLREAQGLHTSGSPDLPELDAPVFPKRSTPTIIGKWYCPFVYIKESSARVNNQMQNSLLYELTLKQWWESIYSCQNEGNIDNNLVIVSTSVKRFVTLVYGMEAEKEDGNGHDGFVWFGLKQRDRKKASVGLSSAVFEKLKWLQERRGWFDGGEGDVRVEGAKEITSEDGWRRFGCYVLVESFVLRKMDGSLLINFNFKNTNAIECKCV